MQLFLDREKLKRKLEESGGLTFQIPQFSTEYGMRRVPTVKKVKQQKTDKAMRPKTPKDKREKGLKKKLTAKMVGDSLDLILSQSKGKGSHDDDDDEEDEERERDRLLQHHKSPPKIRPSSSTSSAASLRKGSAEKVRQENMKANKIRSYESK